MEYLKKEMNEARVDSLMKKLTLVIPSYNRPDYLIRNMSYWSGRGPIVHILDGSEHPIESSLLHEFDKNIKYHHIPTPLEHRINEACGLIETEYASLLADDELFIPSTLQSSIEELEENPELVSCMGRCMSFYWENGSVYGNPQYPRMKNLSISDNSPEERMLRHMQNYVPSSIYSVVRSNIWKTAFKQHNEFQTSVLAIWELQVEISICYLGKTKIIPKLHWLRSMENQSVHRALGFRDWWDSKKFRAEQEIFFRRLAKTLSATDGREFKSVLLEVSKAFDTYVKHQLAISRYKKRLNLRREILRKVPDSVKSLIKQYLPLTLNSQKQSLLEKCEEMTQSEGLDVNFEELTEFVTVIEAFHKGE